MLSNHSEHQEVEDDPEKTLVSPRFDEEAVSRAKPAVALSQIKAKSSKPGLLIITAIVAGLLGGIFGSVLAVRYLTNRTTPESSVAQSSSLSEAKGTLSTDEGQVPLKSANGNESSSASANQQKESENEEAPDNVEESPSQPAQETENSPPPAPEKADQAAQGQELRQAFNTWFEAHKAGDMDKQRAFYSSSVGAFHRWRSAERGDGRAEKNRDLEKALVIQIEAGEPEVKLSPDGQQATIRYRKRYKIEGREGNRDSEVLQELRWQRINSRWRIVSERDLKAPQ
jgi:predicted lipid-binding transport protein (Tim44 family)